LKDLLIETVGDEARVHQVRDTNGCTEATAYLPRGLSMIVRMDIGEVAPAEVNAGDVAVLRDDEVQEIGMVTAWVWEVVARLVRVQPEPGSTGINIATYAIEQE
jgi:hypothetical protein